MVALVVVVASCLAVGDSRARPARAQAPLPTAAGVEATLHTAFVRWTTTPSVFVQAQLLDANNRPVANATGLADDQGIVVLRFGGGGRQPGMPGQAPAAAVITAGHVIRLQAAGGEAVAVAVPDLAAGADVAGNRVVGRAPAGVEVEVEARVGGAPVSTRVTADAGGMVALALAPSPALAPGDGGAVRMLTAEGNRFSATFHVLQAEVTIGARQVSGRATLGTTVTASVTSAAGRPKGSGSAAVSGEDAWQIVGGRATAVGAVEPGDSISVTQTSPLPGATFTITGVVPHLSVHMNPATGQVEGAAPAGAPLTVELVSPYDERYERLTTADPTGAYSVDCSDIAGFGRGWTAGVLHRAGGLGVRAVQTMEQVRVGVHRSLVNGVAQPGQLVTVTLRSADGRVKALSAVRVGGQGQFQTFFGGGDTIAVSDVVEVEFVAGDPVSVLVAPVSAQTDAEADRVFGEAPAGSAVRVSQGTGSNQRVVIVAADELGRYSASFAGVLDIAPPMSGDLVVRLPSGHELFTGWAAVQMTIEIGQPLVSGNGPLGRSALLQLVDPSGATVASGEALALAGPGQGQFGPGQGPGPAATGAYRWTVRLADTLEASVAARPGDTLRATVGDDRFHVLIPELSGAAFVSDDVVNGHTSPDREVTIRLTRPLTRETAATTVTSDANGNFSHDFTDTFDIQHNDAVLFTTLEAGHIINSRVFVPGLRIDLDTAMLVGSWRPDADLLVELSGPSGPRASAQVRTRADAVFNLLLTDRSGARTLPEPGDTIHVEPLGEMVDTPLEMTVPELTLAWSVKDNAIGGRATPGGSIVFSLRDVIDRGAAGPQMRRAEPPIEADGTYSVAFRPAVDLLPGMEMESQYRLPSGHIAVRTRTTALLNVQHGGANVCGFALPLERVTAVAQDAGGTELARGSAQAGHRSAYALQLRAPDGALLATGQGQRVAAVLAGETVSMTLPALDVRVDWATGRISGTGPERSAFQVLRPARGCLDMANRAVQRGRTGPDGQFVLPMPGLDPGDGFELAFFAADGHRFYRHVFRSLGQVYVHTERVAGRAMPQSRVAVTLSAPDGSPKGVAEAVTDANGRFDTRLADGSGAPAVSLPGDRVRLETSGETPDIEVEELRFDWSPGEPIVGTAPAGREVRVTVALQGPSASFTLPVAADGTFRLEAGDIPPRSAWSLGDIQGVRVVLETASGHEMVSETGVAPPLPPERPHAIYLPRATKRY